MASLALRSAGEHRKSYELRKPASRAKICDSGHFITLHMTLRGAPLRLTLDKLRNQAQNRFIQRASNTPAGIRNENPHSDGVGTRVKNHPNWAIPITRSCAAGHR